MWVCTVLMQKGGERRGLLLQVCVGGLEIKSLQCNKIAKLIMDIFSALP